MKFILVHIARHLATLLIAALSPWITLPDLPDVGATTEPIQANDNRRPGGTLEDGVLARPLRVAVGVWRSEGDDGRPLVVEAFGEVGSPLSVATRQSRAGHRRLDEPRARRARKIAAQDDPEAPFRHGFCFPLVDGTTRPSAHHAGGSNADGAAGMAGMVIAIHVSGATDATHSTSPAFAHGAQTTPLIEPDRPAPANRSCERTERSATVGGLPFDL